MRFETCCFSGHRVIPEDVREPLREALEREIRFLIKCGLYCFCSGGALGFDLMAAQVVLELKKEHPCGSRLWQVLRVGMDFRLRCQGCGHELMLPRSKAEKSIKKVIRSGEDESV